MINLFELTYSAISSPQFLLAIIAISFCVKFYFLSILIPQGLKSAKIQRPWWFLLGILIGSMFGDIAWVIKLCREIWFAHAHYSVVVFIIRIAWGFLILQYQSLALFIESLTEKKFQLRGMHKVMLFISGIITLYFFYLAFFDISTVDEVERNQEKNLRDMPLEFQLMRYMVYYLFNLLMFPSIYVTVKKLRHANLPLILKKQLRIFLQFLLMPYVLIEFLQAAHFLIKSFQPYLYPMVSISTVLLIYAVYYCIQRVMGLRFLNFASQVQSQHKVTFIDDFKIVLDQLSYTTNIQELSHIIQTFFKDAFNVPLRKSIFCIRSIETNNQKNNDPNNHYNKNEAQVENFITQHEILVSQYINKHKVLIYDEIAFSNFYDEDTIKKHILTFLENINADIFLPIYEKQKIVAYVIVERHARLHEFYSNVERDEMIVFASYLGNILNLLKNRSFESKMQQENELREELYNQYQEMNQYKESIRSFLRNTRQKDIGIIFYKNRRFIFANQTAKELIKVNINTQEGHPITQALKQIARQVEEYKSSQSMFTKDPAGNKIVVCGVPNLDASNVIITLYYPEISDIITKQIVMLKDPTKWDYLLYLEMTQAGQLVHQLIPGSKEILLHFKINLLKIALGRKATLLDFPEEDLNSVIDLLHHISNRESLQTITLSSSEKNFEYAIKIFGINPTINSATSWGNIIPPFLKKLDHSGTLVIRNVEFLDIETQEYLAEYIKTGYYRLYKSDQRVQSNVRVICSTHQNLQALVHENAFSKSLFDTLNKTILSFPSFALLPEQELFDLIDGFTEQAIKTHAFKNLLELTDKEKSKLILKRPESLQELKIKVQHALVQKSKKNQIYHETQFDPAYSISNPELAEAARLGKHALRDSKIMAILWNKFKNQNQIATFLGVNRSSVNRRCKDYSLQ